MIPKILHYCWFGRGEYPELIQKCIESWHKYLPEGEWQYMLWNEDTFDINSHPYVKEAYCAKKYAFVSDYVRLWALSKYGGVYMDTDAQVIKSLDDLLSLPGFLCYENSITKEYYTISMGTIGAEADNLWVDEMLSQYNGRHFLKVDGSFDNSPNTRFPVQKMKEGGFEFSFDYPTKIYKDCMWVFNPHYFNCYMSPTRLEVTSESYVIHHYMNSWMDPVPLWKRKLREITRPFRKFIKRQLNKIRH